MSMVAVAVALTAVSTGYQIYQADNARNEAEVESNRQRMQAEGEIRKANQKKKQDEKNTLLTQDRDAKRQQQVSGAMSAGIGGLLPLGSSGTTNTNNLLGL